MPSRLAAIKARAGIETVLSIQQAEDSDSGVDDDHSVAPHAVEASAHNKYQTDGTNKMAQLTELRALVLEMQGKVTDFVEKQVFMERSKILDLMGPFDCTELLARKKRTLFMTEDELQEEMDRLEGDVHRCVYSNRLRERHAVEGILGTAALRGDHTADQKCKIFKAFTRGNSFQHMRDILRGFGYQLHGKYFVYRPHKQDRYPDAATNYASIPNSVDSLVQLVDTAPPDLLNYIFLYHVHRPMVERTAKAKRTREENAHGNLSDRLDKVKRERMELASEATSPVVFVDEFCSGGF